MKIQVVIVTILTFFSANLLAGNFKCTSQAFKNYLSVGLMEKKGNVRFRYISESEQNFQKFARIADAKVAKRTIEGEQIIKNRRLFSWGNTCSDENEVKLEDLMKFGLPPVISEDMKVGKRWQRSILLHFNGKEVPINISYKYEGVDKLLDSEVAVITLTLTGLEYDESAKKKWAGLGREIWDIEEGLPLIRLIEIKRGKSFTKDADFTLSYSEAAVF